MREKRIYRFPNKVITVDDIIKVASIIDKRYNVLLLNVDVIYSTFNRDIKFAYKYYSLDIGYVDGSSKKLDFEDFCSELRSNPEKVSTIHIDVVVYDNTGKAFQEKYEVVVNSLENLEFIVVSDNKFDSRARETEQAILDVFNSCKERNCKQYIYKNKYRKIYKLSKGFLIGIFVALAVFVLANIIFSHDEDLTAKETTIKNVCSNGVVIAGGAAVLGLFFSLFVPTKKIKNLYKKLEPNYGKGKKKKGFDIERYKNDCEVRIGYYSDDLIVQKQIRRVVAKSVADLIIEFICIVAIGVTLLVI